MNIVIAATVVFALAAITPSLGATLGTERYTATAYCSCGKCCGKWADGITATGTHAHWGTIAADWRLLPRGTRVGLSCFPGQVFVVEDRGGAIKGERIDVWHPSHRSALKFGVRGRIRIRILAEPPGH